MSASKSLLARAELLTDEVMQRVEQNDGAVFGSIQEIRDILELDCRNNVLRTALEILHCRGQLRGAAHEDGPFAKRYVYVLDTPEKRLVDTLRQSRRLIGLTASQIGKRLGLQGLPFTEIEHLLATMRAEGKIVAERSTRVERYRHIDRVKFKVPYFYSKVELNAL